MKNANMDCVLEKAMQDFKDAYDRLLVTVGRYERTLGVDINNLKGFTENYPFDKSFDELEIDKWVTSVIEGLQQPKFTVLNYEYFNTGGNCMVSVHTVWLPDKNQTVYMLTNEEGCTMSTVDYISNELPIDDYDELMIESVDWGRVTGHEKYFELYRRCLNDYTKDDCKYFGITRGIPYHLLSDELQKQITADYLVYCEAEHGGLIDTDGHKLIVYPCYEQPVEYNDEGLQQIKDFEKWHTEVSCDVDTRESLYDKDYQLTLADRTVRIPFNADTWDAVDNLLKRTVEEW